MEENSNWVLEVEEALLDEAPPERIRVLLAGESCPGNFCSKYLGRPLPLSLRSDVWTHCLEISERKSRVEKFDDVYDHPEQSAIHQVFRGPLRGAFSTFYQTSVLRLRQALCQAQISSCKPRQNQS